MIGERALAEAAWAGTLVGGATGDLVSLATLIQQGAVTESRDGERRPLTALRVHGLVAESLFGVRAVSGRGASAALRLHAMPVQMSRVRAAPDAALASVRIEVPAGLWASADECAALTWDFLAREQWRPFAAPFRVQRGGEWTGGFDGILDSELGTALLELQCVQQCGQGLLRKKMADKAEAAANNVASIAQSGTAHGAAARSARWVVLVSLEVDQACLSADERPEPRLSAELFEVVVPAPGVLNLQQRREWVRPEQLAAPEPTARKRKADEAALKRTETRNKARALAQCIAAPPPGAFFAQGAADPDAPVTAADVLAFCDYAQERWGENAARTKQLDKIETVAKAKWGWSWVDGAAKPDVQLWKQPVATDPGEPPRRLGWVCRRGDLLAAHCAEHGLAPEEYGLDAVPPPEDGDEH